MRRRKTFARPLDTKTIAEGMRGPGTDTRQWVSFGIVTSGDDPSTLVVFDEEDGCPYVRVLLEPSKIPVRARVGAAVAGRGEGEWFPFVEGEEVVVLIPQGDERAGCVIVCRLNNALDRFPMESVAGQDPTTNTFGFRRRRTPVIEEFAGPLIMRSAMTGALISLDTAGNVTLRNGEASALQMSADVIGIQGPSSSESPPRFLLQADLQGERFQVQYGNSLMMLNSENADSGLAGQFILTVPNEVTVGIGTNVPAEHVATIEFVLACLGIMAETVTLLEPAMLAVEAALATGKTALRPETAAALSTGLPLAAAVPKPPPTPNGVQLAPGLGAVRFKTG